jgi:hypothetical protein
MANKLHCEFLSVAQSNTSAYCPEQGLRLVQRLLGYSYADLNMNNGHTTVGLWCSCQNFLHYLHCSGLLDRIPYSKPFLKVFLGLRTVS